MPDIYPHNTNALFLGTGEFYFAYQATTSAEAQALGYRGFGNVNVLAPKPAVDVYEHEGSYRGKRIVDRRYVTKAQLEYSLEIDEISRQNLMTALGGTPLLSPSFSVKTSAQADTLGVFSGDTVGLTKGLWYDIQFSGLTYPYITTLALLSLASPVSVTADGTTHKVTLSTHGLSAGAPVVFGGTAAPSGLTLGIVYFVVSPATNDFQVATSPGGSPVLFSTAGTAVTVSTHCLAANVDYTLDWRAGKVLILTDQASGAVIPIVTTSGASPDGYQFTPMQNLVRPGFGKVVLYDDNLPGKVAYRHDAFGCQIRLDSIDASDGKKTSAIKLTVSVDPNNIGTIWTYQD
jgi:hypothetical protein